MNVLIKPNLDKPEAGGAARRIAEKLRGIAARRGQDLEILLDAQDRYGAGGWPDAVFLPLPQALTRCDVVIPVGGDGTIMRTAQLAAQAGRPILGVNAGRVGFLTQLEIHEIDELERLFTGEYTVLNRMMMEAQTDGGDGAAYFALNDVVVRHGDADRIVDLAVRRDGKLIASHRADGVILSTPTGSTAYSMSAGGPIVSPGLELILMTAICSHSAWRSSLVLPPDGVYEVRGGVPGIGMYVSVDGVRVGRLEPGGAVTVRRSAVSARFIELGLREFFHNVGQKLSWR